MSNYILIIAVYYLTYNTLIVNLTIVYRVYSCLYQLIQNGGIMIIANLLFNVQFTLSDENHFNKNSSLIL